MIQNLGLLDMFEVETDSDGILLITDKQFRNRDNFKNENLHSLIASQHIMPGFCFKRKIDGYSFDVNYSGTLGVYDINLNLVAQIPNQQVEFYQSDGYEYVKLRPHRGYFAVTNGNSYLDDSTYMKIKPGELSCGWYHYILTLTKNQGIEQKLYCSEMFQITDDEVVTDKINLVENGDFVNGLIGWNTAGTWSFSGGVATNSANAGGLVLDRDIIITDSSKYRYKISFYVESINLLSSPFDGLEIRVYHSSTYKEIQALRVRTTGQFIFYADDVNTFRLYATQCTFAISNLRIEKIIGYEQKVYLQAENLCRNIAALPGENYFDFTLLDAEILSPEYGEELKQDENGNLEKLNSFARAFKLFDIEPLLLPEFMIDFISKLNTFDYVHVYDGKLKRLFELNTTVDETEAISINNFVLKNQWEGNDVYGLINLQFEQNLAIKNTCCDEVDICNCDEDFEPLIQVTQQEEDYVVNISPVGGPSSVSNIYPACSLVELWYGVATGQTDIDCEGLPAYQITYRSSGIIVSGEEFNENGIDFQMEDGKSYCFYVKVTQNGCFYNTESNHEAFNCAAGSIPFEFDIDLVSEPDGFGAYNVTITPTVELPSGLTIAVFKYSSPATSIDCDAIATGSYVQFGSSISSDDFNSTGFVAQAGGAFESSACFFVRVYAKACVTADSDSPRHFVLAA